MSRTEATAEAFVDAAPEAHDLCYLAEARS